MSAQVSLEGVTKKFGRVVALDNVSVGIRPGEFFTLLGESGSGKSTLLRVIGGFHTPDQGRVHIAGSDVTRTPPNRRPTAMVFQDYALFPHLNTFENVAFGLRVRRLPRKTIEEKVYRMLDMMRMRPMADRMPRALSGGQQQRVALARALVTEPTILLLDEPLSALDANLREEMQREIKRIQRLVGITAVYVTHDQAEAMGMSDRIAVLSRGKVEQIGTPEDIYYRPATKLVASFIGKATLFPIEQFDQDAIKLQGAVGRVPRGLFHEVSEGAVRFLVVREDHIRVVAGIGDGISARYAGRILDVRFTGGSHLYQVETENHILCSVMAETGATLLPLNSPVQLQIGR